MQVDPLTAAGSRVPSNSLPAFEGEPPSGGGNENHDDDDDDEDGGGSSRKRKTATASQRETQSESGRKRPKIDGDTAAGADISFHEIFGEDGEQLRAPRLIKSFSEVSMELFEAVRFCCVGGCPPFFLTSGCDFSLCRVVSQLCAWIWANMEASAREPLLSETAKAALVAELRVVFDFFSEMEGSMWNFKKDAQSAAIAYAKENRIVRFASKWQFVHLRSKRGRHSNLSYPPLCSISDVRLLGWRSPTFIVAALSNTVALRAISRGSLENRTLICDVGGEANCTGVVFAFVLLQQQ